MTWYGTEEIPGGTAAGAVLRGPSSPCNSPALWRSPGVIESRVVIWLSVGCNFEMREVGSRRICVILWSAAVLVSIYKTRPRICS